MHKPAKWFERKFEFSSSLELFPNLLIRLRGLPPRIEELLRDRPHSLLVRKLDNAWSIQEQAGHLLDIESLWLTRTSDFLNNATELTPADLRNTKTHAANHNASELSTILSQLRQLRTEHLSRLDALTVEVLARTLPHPRLRQPMRFFDHLNFIAEHDDHHLAAIWSLLHSESL